MAEPREKRPLSIRDLATGTVLLAVGIAAAYEARTFDEASRLFPAVTAGLLAAAGLMIALHAIVKPGGPTENPGIGQPLLACLAIALWALAFAAGAGFLGPTFFLQLALFRIAGIRNRATLVFTAALVSTLAYLLFVTVLDVPLPPSRLPAVLQGF